MSSAQKTAHTIRAELERRLEPTQRLDHEIAPDLPLRLRYLDHVPLIICADGFKMSVQASKSHYCLPRDSAGPWHQVEVGFPTEKVEAFMPFIDGDDNTDPTETVYAFVPIDIVAQAIADHGGFAEAEAR